MTRYEYALIRRKDGRAGGVYPVDILPRLALKHAAHPNRYFVGRREVVEGPWEPTEEDE